MCFPADRHLVTPQRRILIVVVVVVGVYVTDGV